MINLLKRKSNKNKDLIVLIDGEHYPQVTYDAIVMLKRIYPGNFKGIVFLGGTEKLVVDDLEVKLSLFGADYPGIIAMILPPGAFLGLGVMLAARNKIQQSLDARK